MCRVVVPGALRPRPQVQPVLHRERYGTQPQRGSTARASSQKRDARDYCGVCRFRFIMSLLA